MPNIADINSETRLLCDTDATGYIAADLLRRINAAYEYVVGFIIGCDGQWQFDDSNFTDFPIGTFDLMVAGQNDYAFNSAMLEIERMEVLNNLGIWQPLSTIDISQISGAIDEYQKVDGLPREYDKQGGSILLYPAPDAGISVTLANGLRVYYQRTADIFTSAQVTTGTKLPGFASPFHYILSYLAALPYCQSYKPERVAMLMAGIAKFEQSIKEHYSRREKDRRKKLTMKGISFR